MKEVAIIFWSGSGNTELMAQSIAKGVLAEGGSSNLIDLNKNGIKSLDSFDRIALGCPSMGSEVLESGTFEPFYESIKPQLKGKKVALFGSYGWGDGEWMRDWEEDLEHAGGDLFEEGLIVMNKPGTYELVACFDFGKRFLKA